MITEVLAPVSRVFEQSSVSANIQEGIWGVPPTDSSSLVWGEPQLFDRSLKGHHIDNHANTSLCPRDRAVELRMETVPVWIPLGCCLIAIKKISRAPTLQEPSYHLDGTVQCSVVTEWGSVHSLSYCINSRGESERAMA